MRPDETDHTRLMLAVFLAALLLISWQAMVQWPKRQHLARYTVSTTQKHLQEQQKYAQSTPGASKEDVEENSSLTRDQRLSASPRIAIDSNTLHGSISLKGARFDDLSLVKYRETIDPKSPEVILFSPNGDEKSYFAQIGWVSPDGKTRVPDQNSLWEADKKNLAPGETVNLKWNNGEGVIFGLSMTLDENYMFDIAQHVENRSGHEISVTPYAYINRVYEEPKTQYAILHEGPLGVIEHQLTEVNYKDLREKGNKVFDNVSGWLGITDKYWESAIIPEQGTFKATFSHYLKHDKHRYQTDYIGQTITVNEGATADYNVRLFAGAKELRVLDHYADGDAAHPPIPLFDRSVDFGYLYFLTKPMLIALTFFYAHTGNFGIAIMLLTICVKLLLYPLANKAYKATSQMRELQPEMNKLKEKYFDDKIRLQQETMALYKREKVNPASGCLPLIIQMPVFFALYKVLFVSIEMRHAPFFGWIHDLSAPDPSNIFTLFGLIPWPAPVWLTIGILPICYCITMVIQMRQQPTPPDPVQARMMKFMPYFLLYVFAKFQAGLVIYWTWSNLISIVQQKVISTRHHAAKEKKLLKAAV